MNIYDQRINELRKQMADENIDLFVIPDTDPHGSEYVHPHWQLREWLSGFTGSAGILIVTQKKAGLWTDFRYFIEATEVLKDTGIDLYKVGTEGVPGWEDWTILQIREQGMHTLAVDGRLLDAKTANRWEEQVSRAGAKIRFDVDLSGVMGVERPPLPATELEVVDTALCGETRVERINRIREQLRGGDFLLVTALDEIAWLLNLRARDVDYCPVAVSYVLLEREEVSLCIDTSRMSSEICRSLEADGVGIFPYEAFDGLLEKRPKDKRPAICLEALNKYYHDRLLANFDPVYLMSSPIGDAKAQKNASELGSLRKVMEEDGRALVGFFAWFEQERTAGKIYSEVELGERIRDFRALSEGFAGESFSPIVGYGKNGALCHYSADPGDCARIEEGNLLLIDSGGQYRGGTTDITRTLSIGEPTDSQKADYTRVLKGHIALSRAVFPVGTKGFQLDILARQPLWEVRENYGHGTGHGVGFYLNVHEGPARISPAPIDVALEPGMVLSNEPGIYREGAYGIRIENLVAVRIDEGSADFLRFETLTLCPFERELIDVSLLKTDEVEWINLYHEEVFRRLSPGLSGDLKSWLEAKTRRLETSCCGGDCGCH